MSNQFNNQRCSKCHQTYSGLRATCYDSSCDREHFFKKNGQLFCIMCLMREGNIKCQKCRKSITRLEEMGKWRGNMFSSDDHTYDINNFGCECRECNHSENKKNKSKRCQGTFYVHYNNGCCEGEHNSMQFNQCDSTVPMDGGDFCQQCKGQTETYQQVKARIAAEHKSSFEKFKQAYEKAQNYWNSLSSSGRERECERLVENIKLGKYWLGEHWVNRDVEGYASGWAHNSAFWGIKNGKLTSSTPHLPPVELAEEFSKKEFGNQELVLRDFQIVKKDDKGNSPSPNPAAPASQSITNSDSKSDNSVSPSNSPQPNPGKDKSSEGKNEVKTIKFENKENGGENNSTNSVENSPNQADNKTLIINLKNVKKITLTAEGNLVIEFDNKQEGKYSISQTITPDQINNNQELQKVKNYLDKNNQSSLSQHELNELLSKNNNDSVSAEKPKDNNLLLVGGIVGGALIVVGIGIRLFLRKKKVKKN